MPCGSGGATGALPRADRGLQGAARAARGGSDRALAERQAGLPLGEGHGARAERSRRRWGAMNFGFTEEQELLRAEVRRHLDESAPIARVREVVESQDGFDRELWSRMAALGWVGLTTPEDLGGVGADLVTLVVVLEEAGRTLLPSPLVSTVLASEAILRGGTDEQRRRWLPSLADGSRIGTLAVLEERDGFAESDLRVTG